MRQQQIICVFIFYQYHTTNPSNNRLALSFSELMQEIQLTIMSVEKCFLDKFQICATRPKIGSPYQIGVHV